MGGRFLFTKRKKNKAISLVNFPFFLDNFCEEQRCSNSVKHHWGKTDDRNCNYGHLKMADVESGKNLFCRLNCFYNVL